MQRQHRVRCTMRNSIAKNVIVSVVAINWCAQNNNIISCCVSAVYLHQPRPLALHVARPWFGLFVHATLSPHSSIFQIRICRSVISCNTKLLESFSKWALFYLCDSLSVCPVACVVQRPIANRNWISLTNLVWFPFGFRSFLWNVAHPEVGSVPQRNIVILLHDISWVVCRFC